MPGRLEIRIGELSILGAPYNPRNLTGLYVAPKGFRGWDSMPAGRREAVAIPFAHGEFDLPVFRNPRVLAIQGVALADSEFALGQLQAGLTGCGADGSLVPLVVAHQGRVLESQGRVVEATFNDEGVRGRRLRASWSLQVVCPNPRKFGLHHQFDGSPVQVSHRGNFPASPVLRVSGSSPSGYTLTGPAGRQIVVTRALQSSAAHTIDLARGGLTVGSTRVQGGISRYQPWTIPPGQQVSIQVSGDLTLRVATRDTFL